MTNQNNPKSLSEVFRELERDKNRQVELYKKNQKEKEESSFLFHVKQRTKKDNVILVLIVLIIMFIVSLFSRNYIFAVNVDDGPKNAIGDFEKNSQPKDIYAILSKNLSSTEQKEVFDSTEDINYEIEYISNKDMPEDEMITLQDGITGSKVVTYVTSYENGKEITKNSIGERVLQEAQNKIVEIGTSKALKQFNVHIGDNLYPIEDVELKKNVNINSDKWLVIPKSYDVKIIEVIDDAWIKVSFNNKKTGYIPAELLTSETLSPGIGEISRKLRILDKVNIDMALNEPSGLSLSDYQRILSNLPSDTNNVFKENYKAFYDAEIKYGINGVFLTSIAIHESGWGTSSIAVNKHNLFGYGAYDSSPYESAVTFSSYSDGIDTVAKWLVSNYLNPAGTMLKSGEMALGRYYNGPSVKGVNVRYASDLDWGESVFSTMKNLYSEL